ncbi:Crp/Fnr family transcriptional regulator [Phenylobacterium kunshanense]|uniref:Crp/Fnr family transcriptional regulator n=1 Tax=Phenylobacterium kunshanense TaxID=1445034 RepID=A0A328B7Z0_9CAUL|nr:Crp/Fnr family transcriptional regulator [Phenylobacterium kunshanense]RAK63037.1 Crp/Fnr family transcriptional regulator [Phenylobacterium kunshanense]
MNGAAVAEKLRALRAAAPFRALDEPELQLVAEHARLRAFSAGEVILAAGTVADALFVEADGSVFVAGRPAPPVFDAPGLLFGLAATADYVSGPEGFRALVLAKPHVFTIARECPEFVVGLRNLLDGGLP